MPAVLGVHVGHDAAAALVVDGEIVASVAEERFRRIKHYGGLPTEAIAYCLTEGRIRFDQLDEVALTSGATDGGSLRKLMNLGPGPVRDETLDRKVIEMLRSAYHRLSDNQSSAEEPPLYLQRWSGGPVPMRAVEHHLAHAASAFLTAGSLPTALVITADGIGDGCSLAIWKASAPHGFDCLYRVGAEGSLGWFYALVTEALGWWAGDGEGKTMGLAPYGSTTGVHGILDPYCPVFSDGRLHTPHDFGRPGMWLEESAYHWHFAEAAAVAELVRSHGAENIAAEAQRVLEREMVPLVEHWTRAQNTRVACFAGGVMLNVKMNQRIWESGALDVQHIFPDAGDAGLAAGAALFANASLGGRVPAQATKHAYWGPGYHDDEIESLLRERRLDYERVADPAKAAAERLAAGKIVGWFQGRMEAGPRALGNRSILMDPGRAENKDVINARVKFREAFRPFCPSMTPEAARQLLDPRARPERYMITSFDVIPEARPKIPAVVHVDGTARPQIVEPDVNPLFHRLLVEFGKSSGVECVLNTSFNIKGEPIVCHPREAIRCFYDTGLDSLVIGSFVLDKRAGAGGA